MSVAEEGGNKPVYTDFSITILIIRIARRKDAENSKFLKNHADAGLS